MLPARLLGPRVWLMPSGSEPTMELKACALPLASVTSHWYGNCRECALLKPGFFFHRLCGAGAVVEGLEPDVVKARFSDQVAVLLARAGGRAIRRRLAFSAESVRLPLDVVGVLVLEP